MNTARTIRITFTCWVWTSRNKTKIAIYDGNADFQVAKRARKEDEGDALLALRDKDENPSESDVADDAEEG